MSPSVLTLVLLVDVLAPGGRAEPWGAAPCPAGLAGPDHGAPLWSVPATEPERRERRAALPETRPDLECGSHRHDAGGPDHPGGGMSVAAGDEEDPICYEDSRCSPVPTERSGVVPALKAFKGLIEPPVRCPAPTSPADRGPARLGEPSRGFVEPLFHPPR